MTNTEIENRIARVNATMAMEGMPLTDEQKETMRKMGQGYISCDEVIKDIIKKYSKVGK